MPGRVGLDAGPGPDVADQVPGVPGAAQLDIGFAPHASAAAAASTSPSASAEAARLRRTVFDPDDISLSTSIPNAGEPRPSLINRHQRSLASIKQADRHRLRAEDPRPNRPDRAVHQLGDLLSSPFDLAWVTPAAFGQGFDRKVHCRGDLFAGCTASGVSPSLSSFSAGDRSSSSSSSRADLDQRVALESISASSRY